MRSICNYSKQCTFLFQFLLIFLPLNAAALESPLIGYSDYHILTDPAFDAEQYFKMMKEKGINLQRIWVIGYGNALDHIDERMPFEMRRGKYNLNKIDRDFLIRLDTILQLAEQNNQKVMLTLFDHWALTKDELFVKTPWFFKNNTDRLMKRAFPDFYDVHNRKLARVQKNYVQAIVQETKRYNPIYEIMNEPTSADCSDIKEWHDRVSQWILEVHENAILSVNVEARKCSTLADSPWVDLISLHYGDWEEGICQAVNRFRHLNKPVIIDTDGAFKYRDDNRLVKRWLKESLECGASFNHKDDIYSLDHEALEILGSVNTERTENTERKEKRRD